MEEEVVEVATKVAFSFKPAIVAAVGIASAAAGAGISWFVTKKIYKIRFEALATAEIAEAKEFYERHHKAGRFSTPENAAAAMGWVSIEPEQESAALEPVVVPDETLEAFRTYRGDPRPNLEVENIFKKEPIPERSLVETSEKFISPINPDGPYVITEDEYNDGEVGYTQVALTYFAGDDTLADEDDAPIFEVNLVVGDALLRFGEGSGSAGNDVVFVRNSKSELDMEIRRSPGKYSVEVAGLKDDELRHSSERIPRRRRHLQDD